MKSVVHITVFLSILLFSASPAFSGNELYVSSGGSATAPYDTWAKSAHDIQTAMGTAIADDTVWVSNGVYVGSMGIAESYTNVVIIPTGVVMRSVNGPSVTTIQGADMKRCVYLSGSNTVLDGFTLTGGILTNGYGAGVYCKDYALLTNCLVISNVAYRGGGCALIGGYIHHCTFETNIAAAYEGGGIYCNGNNDDFGGHVRNCIIRNNQSKGRGAGIYGGRLQIDGCTISGNHTTGGSTDGGGVHLSFSNSCIQNSLIYSNSAMRNGGGIYVQYELTIRNCTIMNNSSEGGAGATFRNGGIVENSIIYGNIATFYSTSNTYWFGTTNPTYTHCCMAPLTNGTDNIDQNPLIDDVTTGSLLESSPCVDAGTNMSWMADAVDLGGDPRVFNEIVDIGADETFVGGVGIDGSGPVEIEWRVPRGAKCQWQTSDDLNGTWNDLASPVTAQVNLITLSDSSPADIRNFRVIWKR